MSQFHLRVKSINNRSNMAGYLALMLFALISTLIACLELNAALINLYTLILRKRQNLLRSFVDGPLQTGQRSRPKPYTQRRFWTRPGRTSAWWDNFVSGIFIPEEWRENFRMSGCLVTKTDVFLSVFGGQVWTVENAAKTLVWTKNFLSVFKKQKTEVFENALVWTGPCWIWNYSSQLGAARLIGCLLSFIQRARGIIVIFSSILLKLRIRIESQCRIYLCCLCGWFCCDVHQFFWRCKSRLRN